ncbi:unnamed protein product, partial [Allacma fusca]
SESESSTGRLRESPDEVQVLLSEEKKIRILLEHEDTKVSPQNVTSIATSNHVSVISTIQPEVNIIHVNPLKSESVPVNNPLLIESLPVKAASTSGPNSLVTIQTSSQSLSKDSCGNTGDSESSTDHSYLPGTTTIEIKDVPSDTTGTSDGEGARIVEGQASPQENLDDTGVHLIEPESLLESPNVGSEEESDV